MLNLRGLSVAILIGGALFTGPAAAQSRSASSSLTHVVSVTVPARVKVKVSSVSMMPSRSIGATVRVTTVPAAASAIGVSVQSNQAWVLSVSAPVTASPAGSKVLWSGTQTGRFTPITSDSAQLAAATHSPTAVDTTVFFQGGKTAPASGVPVVLTVSAP